MAVAEQAPPHRDQGSAAESAALAPSSPPIPLRPQLAPRQPLLYAALSFSAGILLGARAWRPPLWWAIALLVFVAAGAIFLRRRPRWAFALSCGALVLLGAFVIQGRGPPAVNTEILPFADGSEVALTAHVTADGFRRAGGFGADRQVLEVESEQVTAGGVQENFAPGFASPSIPGPKATPPPRQPPCRSTPTASGCGSPPSCARRAISATPAPSTTAAISPSAASPPWVPPTKPACGCSP